MCEHWSQLRLRDWTKVVPIRRREEPDKSKYNKYWATPAPTGLVRVKQKNARKRTHNVFIEEGLEHHVMNEHGGKNSQNCGHRTG